MSTPAIDNPRTYRLIEKALQFCQDHHREQPPLEAIAAHVGLSPSHLQRLFTAWAGVSPKQYLQFLTKEHARECLKEASVLEASLASGLSSASRLHDLLLTWEGVTPGERRSLGVGVRLRYGVFESPFGEYLLVATDKGICKLAFLDSSDALAEGLQDLQADWPQAHVEADPAALRALAARIFTQPATPCEQPLPLYLRGSPFQRHVWQALLSIPEGHLCSYQQLAHAAGQPKAVRAVASAVAANPIGYLIPCHRVIRSTGHFGEYRWGSLRKQSLIGWEAGHILGARQER